MTGRFLASTNENCTPALRHALATGATPNAESPRTRIFPLAPAARAVPTASLTIESAPRPELAFPARSRIPATTGAAVGVLIVVANGESPLRSNTRPAILACPKLAPCF